MSEQQFPERPLDIWQVATLRLTAFPSPGFQPAHPTWWTDLLEDQPETTFAQPKRGRHQEEGPLANGKLILRLEPLRIDWMFTLADDQKEEVEGISTLGPFSEALDTFLPLMDSWFKLETRPPIHRLAFGAILQQPIETREAGYRHLSRYLRYVELDPTGSSDFLYQINRRRDSRTGVTGLGVNRLSKWSVSGQAKAEFAVGVDSATYARGPLNFACHLELDINTIQEFEGELPQEQLAVLFYELVDLGREIALEGDIT